MIKGLPFVVELGDILVLMKIRATYVVQLLVSMCEKTATSFASLFTRLRDPTILAMLAELDSCIVCGVEAFCEVWTTSLEHLNEGKMLSVQAILQQHKVTVVTSIAKRLSIPHSSANGSSPSAANAAPSSCTVFGVNDLIAFTTCDDVLPADANMCLMNQMQLELLRYARPVWRFFFLKQKKLSHFHMSLFSRGYKRYTLSFSLCLE